MFQTVDFLQPTTTTSSRNIISRAEVPVVAAAAPPAIASRGRYSKKMKNKNVYV